MNKFNIEDKLKMLDKIYNLREEEIDINDIEIKEKLNKVTLEEIEISIKEDMINKESKENILNKIKLLIDNYEVKMANCLERGYKQGFKDAFELIIECLEK